MSDKALISHAGKVMLKILQVRFQQYMNQELPDVQAEFRKGRGTRDQIANTSWIIEKAREFRKTSTSTLKTLTVWITTNCGKFLKRWNTRPPYLPPEKPLCKTRSNRLEPAMEQQTDSKLGRGYVKAVCCHPAYLTYMQSTLYKMLGWVNHKLESRFPGEISETSDMQMIPP